jgi:hypothetical protein
MKAKMKSKSTMSTGAKERTEFKGKPAAVKKAEKIDKKSDRSIAKKTGTKYMGY